ncbi:hypothetical protein DPEC_G00124430 [Dallia pectoralis]|uniref:Uncharacterized protein n=1 Tax=Dallia pectoralis TaxID=75939 RepID=A0ACC2GQY4_DALPE|nr:hypothetical protein DPEC_G00124430 [Dallia pectoralis]
MALLSIQLSDNDSIIPPHHTPLSARRGLQVTAQRGLFTSAGVKQRPAFTRSPRTAGPASTRASIQTLYDHLSLLLLHHKSGLKRHGTTSHTPPLPWATMGSSNSPALYPTSYTSVSAPLPAYSSPNRSIIGLLSLVNVASDTSDGSFIHMIGFRGKVGAGEGWARVAGTITTKS